MVHNRRAHEVVASLVTLVDSGQQVHHVFVELAFGVPLTNQVNSSHYNLVDYFARVSVDQCNPLVDDEAFLPELDFNRFEHFYASYYIVEPRF